MSEAAGKIIISLDYSDRRINRLNIRSTRPVSVSRLFVGRSPEQALLMVPLLFTVCGTAQQLAMTRAIEQCRGISEPRSVTAYRDYLLLLENSRELLFRLINDWLPGSSNRLPLLQQWLQCCQQEKAALNSVLLPGGVTPESVMDNRQVAEQLLQILSELLGMPAAEFPDRLMVSDPDGVQPSSGELVGLLWQLQRQFGGIKLDWPLTPLPDLQQQSVRQILESSLAREGSGFTRLPTWQHKCAETGCFAAQWNRVLGMRNRGWYILAIRYAAILVELCQLCDKITDISFEEAATETIVQSGVTVVCPAIAADAKPEQSVGYAVVHSSRGQLLHRLVVENEQITDYSIIAPTEWNLHPQGAIVQSLTGVVTRDIDSAIELIRTVVLLADPCVGFEILMETENKEQALHA